MTNIKLYHEFSIDTIYPKRLEKLIDLGKDIYKYLLNKELNKLGLNNFYYSKIRRKSYPCSTPLWFYYSTKD